MTSELYLGPRAFVERKDAPTHLLFLCPSELPLEPSNLLIAWVTVGRIRAWSVVAELLTPSVTEIGTDAVTSGLTCARIAEQLYPTLCFR